MRLRLIGEIEARHGARIEVLSRMLLGAHARAGPAARRLGGAHMRGWATEECDGLPASPEQKWRRRSGTTRTTRRGFLSFMEYGGFDLRGRLGIEWRLRPLRTRSTHGSRTRLSARARVWLMCMLHVHVTCFSQISRVNSIGVHWGPSARLSVFCSRCLFLL